MKARWWCLLPLLIVAMTGWAGVAAEAHGADRDACEAGKLKASGVVAEIDFDYHDRIYAQVLSNLTVNVSAKEWPLAKDLALTEKSARYRMAMRCLLRGDDKVPVPRNREWRLHHPQVTVRGDWVTVKYGAIAWIEQAKTFLLGPWRIEIDKGGRNWHVALRPPKTLEHAQWERIEVKLNGLEADNIFPPVSSADSVRLVWAKPKALFVGVDVDPPWQRSFNVGERWWSLGWAGVASWWVFTSAVIAVAVLRTSPPGKKGRGWWWRVVRVGDGPTGGPARVVLLWAVLSAAVALMLRLLLMDPPEPVTPSWRHLISIAAGLALLLAARPWCRIASSPTEQKPGSEERIKGVQRRQVWAVTATASAVAVFGSLLVLAPRLFSLKANLTLGTPQATSGVFGLALLGLATLWLWLAAMAAWAWRFAREGDMVRKSWSATWDEAPVRCVVAAGALLAVVAAALLTSSWLAFERNWRRANWLSDQTGTALDGVRNDFLRQFAHSGLTWVYSYAWLLTGIALVALLHIRIEARRAQPDGKNEELSLGPADADLLLTVAVFALAVGLRQVEFAGSNVLFGIWLLMIIASLYVVVAVGRRHSVLSRAGEQFRIRRLDTWQHRCVLLTKAHEFRNLHHKLYSLDRGHGEGLTREELEHKLDELHQWLFAGWGGGLPPAQISVLDAALSWGPGVHWWENARHAASLAFCFGFPASAALVWLSYLKDSWTQMATFQDLIGLPEIAAKFLAWQVAWAGAGLALGALWRLLPGRRSPVRALSLTAAYAFPVCLGALIAQITDTELGYVFLHVALMLLVLTLTSIWMDMATFSDERKLWPSRVGLLLSVYQLRGLSAQVAYLGAQLVIVIGVWHSLAGSESTPR